MYFEFDQGPNMKSLLAKLDQRAAIWEPPVQEKVSSLCIYLIQNWDNYSLYNLKTIAVNKVTNWWRNHNNKTTKISELNKIIELYEL